MGNHWLTDIFLQVLQMSITAAVIICMILGVRLCLRRAPKIFSYLLWSVVLFRLLCPVAVESPFSVFGIWGTPAVSEERIRNEENVAAASQITGDSGFIPAEPTDGQMESSMSTSRLEQRARAVRQPNWKETALGIGSIVWLIGIVCIAGYGFWSTIRLRKRLEGLVHVKDNIYISDCIDAPFAMGILAPKIYLSGFLSEKEKGYIILHEQTHIRRGDLLVKLLAFAALTMHWFNPFVWIAFFAIEQDMEMSCDELVMKQMKADIRAEYSTSLLCLATGKNRIGGTPIAFGEGDIKSRVKNIMRYKKPAAVVMCISAVLVVSCLVGFGTNPGGQKEAAPADTKQENSVFDSEEEDAGDYQRVYSVELDIEKEKIPLEIWAASDSDKKIIIDGQEIGIAPKLAANVTYELVETTSYYDFTGDGNREIALIDTGSSAGEFQTVWVFHKIDGQWKELELPAEIYDPLPEFVTEKLKELEIHTEDSELTYQRTVSFSYENEKIGMNYKLFTDGLTKAIGTVHQDVVYSSAQKKFVLEDSTGFTQAISGESAYHPYGEFYSADLEIGGETIAFEIWASRTHIDKIARIDGQEVPICLEAAASLDSYIEIEVYDFTGDGNEEIALVDGMANTVLIFGNTNGQWEEMELPSDIYNDDFHDPKALQKRLSELDVRTDDSYYHREHSVIFENGKILIGYLIWSDLDSGATEIGTIQRELIYSSKEKRFLWGDTSFIPYAGSENTF